MKNFLAITLLSLGTPMLLMGDEMRRTQLGNNNASCRDNEISWLDWTLLDRHRVSTARPRLSSPRRRQAMHQPRPTEDPVELAKLDEIENASS